MSARLDRRGAGLPIIARRPASRRAASSGTMVSAPPPAYAVTLTDPGPQRLDVMRVLRLSRPDLGMAAAKALVDRAPQVALRDVGHYDVDSVRRLLESTGGRVAVRRNPLT